MDGISRRGRRAVTLIALAVVVIAAASLAYGRVNPTLQTRRASPTPSPVVASLNSITYVFVTPSIGWAVENLLTPTTPAGGFAVYQTTDGAKHWRKQLLLESSFVGFVPLSVQFLDQMRGFIGVGDPFEQLERTSDGGASWDSLPLPSGSARVEAIAFSDASSGWLLVGGQVSTLYVTRDAGSSWERLPNPPPDAGRPSFRSPSEVWMDSAGLRARHVYSSSDAGLSWQRHDLPAPPGQSWVGSVPAGVEVLPQSGVVVFLPPFDQPELVVHSLLLNYPNVTGWADGERAVTGRAHRVRQLYSLHTSFDQGTTWCYLPAPPGVLAYQDSLHWWAMNGTALFKS
jgi:photosystem II stability/assembly factor-like uncharacterized protein